MATPAQRDACCALIRKYFGPIVASVAEVMFKFERVSLRLLMSQMQGSTSFKNVKKSLIILAKHQIINLYKQSNFSDCYDYEITAELVLNFSRSAKYIARAKQIHGEEGELIVKNIIVNGMIRVSNLLHSTWEHLVRVRHISTHEGAKNLLNDIQTKILALIKEHYLERIDHEIYEKLVEIPLVAERKNNSHLDSLIYKISDINLSLFSDQILSINRYDIISELERMAKNSSNIKNQHDEDSDTKGHVQKRAKFDLNQHKTPANDPDRGIYWRINVERFERDLRDQTLSDSVTSHYNDSRTGLICSAILCLSMDNSLPGASFTAPVAHNHLEAYLIKSGNFSTKSELKKYLKILDSDTNFRVICQSGFRPDKGIMYAVDVGQLIDRIVRETLSSMVACRFGPKCGRIFRLLLNKNYLMPKQIEESVMLPVKDVREYLYMLIKEGFVRSCQVPRTADFAPARSLFMMGVEMEFLVMCSVDRCCRSMANVIERQVVETKQNDALLKHDSAVQNLIRSNRAKESTPPNDDGDNFEDDEEYQEYFTRHERLTLIETKKRLNDLELGHHQIDDTLFLFNHWLKVKPNMGVIIS